MYRESEFLIVELDYQGGDYTLGERVTKERLDLIYSIKLIPAACVDLNA